MRIYSGILLKRAPILTRTLDPLSASYLADSLGQSHLPFVSEFYFKKGSTAEQKWHAAQSSGDHSGDQLVQVEEQVALAPRESPADDDVKSLDRLRERSLFLMIKESQSWKLLSGPLEKEGEFLDQGADRILKETMGDQMDVWRVGKAPVGHLEASDHKVSFHSLTAIDILYEIPFASGLEPEMGHQENQ